MVKPSDLMRKTANQVTARRDADMLETIRRNPRKTRKPEDRRRVRNQPLKGNPELFALKKRLEKENGK